MCVQVFHVQTRHSIVGGVEPIFRLECFTAEEQAHTETEGGTALYGSHRDLPLEWKS